MGLKTKKISKISALTYHFVTSLLKGKFTPNRPVSKIVMIMINILNATNSRHHLRNCSNSANSSIRHIHKVTMPRISARAIALRALTASTKQLRQIFLIANFAHLATGNWSVFNQSNESFISLLLFQR